MVLNADFHTSSFNGDYLNFDAGANGLTVNAEVWKKD